MKGQDFRHRLRYAGNGIRVAFQRERSLRTHGVSLLGVVLFLAATDAPLLWWLLTGLAAGLVIVTEMMNTAIETLTDLLHPEQHPEAGVTKDVAAGAVLVASLLAAGVGLGYLFTLAERLGWLH